MIPWWPSDPEFALLDLREGACRFQHFEARSQTILKSCSEPALLRLHRGTPRTWGEGAPAWRERGTESSVLEIFPDGRPAQPDWGRRFLQRFCQRHELGVRKGGLPVYVVEEDPADWTGQLWRETLEDSGLAWRGFLSSWQHDLIAAQPWSPERAASPFLYFWLSEHHSRWALLDKGAPLAEGQRHDLSRRRWLGQWQDVLRRQAALEVGRRALEEALQASALAAERTGQAPVVELAGRHLRSGLPTRTALPWSEFLAHRPAIVEAWNQLRGEWARRVCQAVVGRSDAPRDFDLPGWRRLSYGRFADLWMDGPIARLLERAQP